MRPGPRDGVSASVGPHVGQWSPKIITGLNFLQEMERQVTREEFFFSERRDTCGTRRQIPPHSRHPTLSDRLRPSQSATDPFRDRGRCPSAAVEADGATAPQTELDGLLGA